jgi:hypothetical protein
VSAKATTKGKRRRRRRAKRDRATPYDPQRGGTPRQLSRYLRVSVERVRGWIERGELGAINTAPTRCGRPRYIILPHHLEEFERGRRVATAAETPRRRRREAAVKDYYPDN